MWFDTREKTKKILEIGVSAGGTTAVILKCIENLGLDTQVISIDKATRYSRNSCKGVGWLVEQCREKLRAYGQWEMHTGGGVCEYIDVIGEKRDIDFCIFDTTHTMPGELLDFLICYPYLADNAIVVIHDLLENYYIGDNYPSATQILFDTVVATKYLMWDPYDFSRLDGYLTKYPNIGAFEILPETGKYITDVLSGLMSKWGGLRLSEAEMDAIKTIFCKNYDNEFCNLFDEILKLRARLDISNTLKNHIGNNFVGLLKKWSTSNKIALNGAGGYCKKYSDFAKAFKLQVNAVVISDEMPAQNIDYLDCKVCHWSNLQNKEEYNFVICINDKDERIKIEKFLNQQGVKILNSMGD